MFKGTDRNPTARLKVWQQFVEVTDRCRGPGEDEIIPAHETLPNAPLKFRQLPLAAVWSHQSAESSAAAFDKNG